MLMIKVVKAIIVRAALLLHLTMTVWRVTVDLKDDMYWLMFCATVPFVIESFYTVIKRRGDDFLLFTPCFFFYLITTIPCVWLLELRKTDVYLSGEEDQLFNLTESDHVPVKGLDLDINPNTWTILIEELLLYLLIVGRWVLPRGEVTREQLSELLFAFIGIASDIMEMFSLFGEDQVRRNRTLSYCVLAVWSISVSQFCMTLTVTHRPRKAKNIRVIDDNEDPEKQRATISHEIIAIILSMVMQDLPFVTVRLYTIITYNLITYSLIFFTSKNCLVILLLIYKIAVLLQKRYCPENVHEEMVEDKELYVIGQDDSSDDHKGKKSKMKLELTTAGSGSASTGGSREKERLEKFYEANESEPNSLRERKSKNAEKLKNGKDIPDSPSPSKLDKSSAKPSPKVETSPNHVNKTQPKKSPNEKTPLSPSKPPLNGQTPQSSSTPSSTKRSPSGSVPGTPKTPSTTSQPSAKPSTPANRPRPSPSKTQPNAKTSPQKSSGTPSPQHKQQPNTTSPQRRPQQPPPQQQQQQQQQAQDSPIASGFGWISSKPKEDSDVIVANLS